MTRHEFIEQASSEIEAWFSNRDAGWIESDKFSFDPADAAELAASLWDKASLDKPEMLTPISRDRTQHEGQTSSAL